MTANLSIDTFTPVTIHGYKPDDLIPIGETARIMGVSVGTLRRWEGEDTEVGSALRAAIVRTAGGHRRYRCGQIQALTTAGEKASVA